MFSCGRSHSLIIRKDKVYAAGANNSGELGDGTTNPPANSGTVQVQGLDHVISVKAAEYYSMALKADGTVWTWGNNDYGQLGNGNIGTKQLLPIKIPGLSNIIAIEARSRTSYALKSDGTVWAWGNNTNGELGINDLNVS